MTDLKLQLLSLDKEIIRIVDSTVRTSCIYNKKPWLQNGIIICDEEHFEGFKPSPLLLQTKAAVYVWIMELAGNRNFPLRGVMGTSFPRRESLAQELIDSAFSAAHQDAEHEEITEKDLEKLIYSVDIIQCNWQEINFTSKNIEDFDLNKQILKVEKNSRQTLIRRHPLTQESNESIIESALSKAGISMTENPLVSQADYIRIM